MVSGTLDKFLRRDVAIRLAYEKMEPNLRFLDLITPVPEENSAFMFRYDSTGKASDAKKEKPSRYKQGASFPEIDRSRKLTSAELMKTNGFSMRVPRDVIRNAATGIAELQDDYDFAGYWLAEWLNTNISAAMIAGATTPTWTPTAVWSDTTNYTPVEDLRKFKYQMRREGYPFRLTTVYINIDNFNELEGYLTSIDVNATKQAQMFGSPAGGDQVFIPIAGCDVIGVDSGITEGSILGLDRNNPAAEYHYYNDPLYTVPIIRYTTVESGAEVVKTVRNMGINFDQFVERETHDTILQFWVEGKPVVTKPYGILYDTGI